VALGLAASFVPSFSARRASAALAPPVLEPFDGKWHTDTFLVAGEVDSVRLDSWVRILRDGVVVDSVTTSVDRTFSVPVGLVPGVNRFTAVLRNTNFEVSPPSNTVTVTFDTGAGLFIPVPFAPGASFDLNTARDASQAELRVFDVTGDFVVGFESREPRMFYSFAWDGLNASGERVRRGPLIAVGVIHYPDGTSEVIRRAFLFDPEGSP
jgi:hypothetical protein